MIVRRPEISVKALDEFIGVVADANTFSFPSARSFLSYIDRTLQTKGTFRNDTVFVPSLGILPPQEYPFLYRRIPEVVNHLLFVHRDNLINPTLLPDGVFRYDHAVHAERYQTLLRAFRLTHSDKDILLPLSFFSGKSFCVWCGLLFVRCFMASGNQLMRARR